MTENCPVVIHAEETLEPVVESNTSFAASDQIGQEPSIAKPMHSAGWAALVNATGSDTSLMEPSTNSEGKPNVEGASEVPTSSPVDVTVVPEAGTVLFAVVRDPVATALGQLAQGASLAARRKVLEQGIDDAADRNDMDAVRALRAALREIGSRQERRANRDGLIRALEKNPRTGKPWATEYGYDPRLSEMQELYSERQTPLQVMEHGGKLIRNDGGQFGHLGGVIRALLAGAAEAGIALTPEQLRILTQYMGWDAMERIHGIGAGYVRDAAWIYWLWCTATGELFDISKLPQRKPLVNKNDWAKNEFPNLYEEALDKLGLIEDAVGSDTNAVAVPNVKEDAEMATSPAPDPEQGVDVSAANSNVDSDPTGDENSKVTNGGEAAGHV